MKRENGKESILPNIWEIHLKPL